MAGKEIDPQRARAARDVLRQHPAMTLVVVSPALIMAGLVWWLVSPTLAIVLLLAVGAVAAMKVLRG
ncbi:MAG TPA: hypothetical protein PKK01_13675 [Mycobacterium sp.]|nr:MAG: hypothetical protein E6Q56_02000 [Mycobacterium sp.]HOB50342.1 hypothetical protein [Mycobacterium sp.]HPZ94777.1 hypothetical protein [Mycobacterium sp.]HQE15110.1 hypothetical protein [Mycobacterium sp.]